MSQNVNKSNTIFFEIKEAYRFRWVIYSFITSTLKMRYKRSVLGLVWTMLGPLLNYFVMGFVIAKVARFGSENFLSNLLLGSLVFNFMSVSLNLGGMSLIQNEHYIRKIYLPKLVFPVSSIGMEFVNFVLGFLGLVLVLLFLGGLHPGWEVLTIPFSFVLLFFFSLGLGSILSVIYVFFRDLSHVVPILMQAAFFLTPVIYPVEAIPERFLWLLKFNPFYHYVELIRGPLIKADLNLQSLLTATVLSISSLVLGLFILKKYENKVVFKL
ncbi:MAG TPA: ABC transporter permease [Pseudobdellovibrionaceae bacterium]|nr:ABC transporter permease [Pseudobdellovibrionaceae bacterium]